MEKKTNKILKDIRGKMKVDSDFFTFVGQKRLNRDSDYESDETESDDDDEEESKSGN